MAAIPTTIDNSDMPAAPVDFRPWLIWLLIVLLSVVAAGSLVLLTRWAVVKITKAVAARKDRQEDAKLALPTHLDSFVPRAVVLPLPRPHDQEMQQKGEDEKTHEEMYQECTISVDNSAEDTLPPSVAVDEVNCSSHLPSVAASLFARFYRSPDGNQTQQRKRSKPSWLARLYARVMISVNLMESPTMDLPMQMPPPGWEDELDLTRDEPSAPPLKKTPSTQRSHSEDSLEQDANKVRDETEEDGVGHCTLLQPPACDIVSRSPAALAEILDSSSGSQDSVSVYDDDDDDVDTPVLSPASECSSIDSAEHALCTPTIGVSSLADLTPKVNMNAGLGITHIEEEHELRSESVEIHFRELDIAESFPQFSADEDEDEDEEMDALDAHIASATGYIPRELALDVNFFGASPEQTSFTEDEEEDSWFDNVEDIISTITGYGPTRASILEDVNARIVTVSSYSPTLVTTPSISIAQSVSTRLFKLDVDGLVENHEQIPCAEDAGLDDIDDRIATITGYSPTRASIPDDIDARISAVTGCSPTRSVASSISAVQHTPTKPILGLGALVESPKQMSFTEDNSFDDIDARIATVTGYSPTRVSISDDVDAKIATVTDYRPTLVTTSSVSIVQSTPTKLFTPDVEALTETPGKMSFTEDDRFDDIDARIAAVTGYSPTRASISDDIDARIAAATGCSPSRGTQSSVSCSQQTVQKRMLDDIDAAIAAITGHSPAHSSSTSGSSKDASLGEFDEIDHVDAKIAPLTGQDSTLPSCETLSTGISPISSVGSLETPTKLSKVQGPSQVTDKRIGIPLPRPLSASALPLLSRTASHRLPAPVSSLSKAARRLSRAVSLKAVSTPSLNSRKSQGSARTCSESLSASSTATTSTSIVKSRLSTSQKSSAKPSQPPPPTSSSTPISSTRQSPSPTTPRHTAPPPVAQSTTRSTSLRKMQVSFSPTSTPTPQARAMWRSLATKPSTRTQPVTGDRPTRLWKS